MHCLLTRPIGMGICFGLSVTSYVHTKRDTDQHVSVFSSPNTSNDSSRMSPAAPAGPGSPQKPSASAGLVSGIVVGGIASCLAEVCSYPFDFAKTRMQLHGTVVHLHLPLQLPLPLINLPHSRVAEAPAAVLGNNRPYKGMLDVLRRVPSEDPRGAIALFDGLKPALLRQATYGALKIVIYERLKSGLESYENSVPAGATGMHHQMLASPVFRALFAAGTAGAVSAALCNPTDLIKVRMAAGDRSLDPRYNQGVWRAFKSIVHDEGILGLYKGVSPTTQRAMVMTLLNLPSYDLVKSRMLNSKPTLNAFGYSYTFKDDHWLHLMCGMISALISTYGSQPIDVIKSRIMNQPVDASGIGLHYRSSWHCLTKTVQQEGGLALFKGSVPNLCRSVPWLVIFFVSHEALKKLVVQCTNSSD